MALGGGDEFAFYAAVEQMIGGLFGGDADQVFDIGAPLGLD